ncbi:MAG: metallophosphoesterase [Nitrospirae bacterium]|nr:metallophosphoesterase [Nitrospirota bacterium]
MTIQRMILRFRDLSTKSGDTIALHKKVIEEKGFVFWGWWNKAGENVPEETFREFMSIIDSNGPLDVFLFDTGTLKLYPAKMKSIRWDTRLKEIDPPDWESTPLYYKEKPCKVWYELTEIGDFIKDEKVLREWTYVEVDELFETKKSVFKDFDKKQVFSFNELRHQERTIWFLKEFESGDKTHEILLYDTSRVNPANFPEKIIESDSSTLLWLSDIHFSEDSNHAFPYEKGAQSGYNLFETIQKDLQSQELNKIGGIIITGDLTWKASKKEFERVHNFLQDIMSCYSLSPNQIILCPGNHDIAFSDEPWSKNTPVPEYTEESEKNYSEFYKGLFSVTPNEYLSSGRRLLLEKTFLVDVCSLNSSYLRQTKDVFQGHGYVGNKQQDFVAKEMRWNDDERKSIFPFRIVLLHHHVVPVIPQELAVYEQQSSVVYDAGALCNWIVKKHVNLVLHGHMHHTKILREKRSLLLKKDNVKWHEFTIASLGSTGVASSHNQLDNANVYGIVKFTDKDINLTVRKIYSKEPDTSTDSTSVDLKIPYEEYE